MVPLSHVLPPRESVVPLREFLASSTRDAHASSDTPERKDLGAVLTPAADLVYTSPGGMGNWRQVKYRLHLRTLGGAADVMEFLPPHRQQPGCAGYLPSSPAIVPGWLFSKCERVIAGRCLGGACWRDTLGRVVDWRAGMVIIACCARCAWCSFR